MNRERLEPEEMCGCEHEHVESCGCGDHYEEHRHEEHHHEGEHHHEHVESCGCGHHHEEHHHEGEHHHEHVESCDCEHHHEEVHHHEERIVPSGHKTKVYTLENLGCANCAAKMEAKINQMDGVSNATITFATKQLRLSAAEPDVLIPEVEIICDGIESGVRVIEKQEKRETEQGHAEGKKDLYSILAGGILFLGAVILHKITGAETYSLPYLAVFLVSYLILGGEILLTAGKNILKGQIFDENFLMSIATLGAFIIQEYPEAVGVMLFFRIGEYFEEAAVEKSRSQIMEAVDLRPEVVNLEAGGEVRQIPAKEAVIGDIVLVRPGDRIPLDGEIIEGESRIDTSAVTGEPVPVKAGIGTKAVSGCVNLNGLLKIRVEKPLEESMVSRILNSVENAAASKPKIDHFITRFARVYTPIVVVVALFTAVGIPLITGQEFYPWVYTALSFLVMSCPCAVVLSVPLAFFCGIGAGSRQGILFKGGVALETLRSVQAVVMDKTGTITKGNFAVQKIEPKNGRSREEVLALAAACETASTHPIAVSILDCAKEQGLEIRSPEEIEEISGKGIKAVQEGKTLLCGNVKLMEEFQVDTSDYKKDGVGSEVLLAVDGVYAGYLLVSDTMKEEAPTAISHMKRQNLRTVMLTGDEEESAMEVAKAAGVEEVHARLLPEEKLSELQKIRKAHGSVMFVGDGINDAPVLAGADVGAAMGSGADAAIEAADVVFMNSNMDAIPSAIGIAHRTTAIAKQNVIFAIAVKMAVLVLGITGIYSNMWLAVFADTGVAFLCILNSIRILRQKQRV